MTIDTQEKESQTQGNQESEPEEATIAWKQMVADILPLLDSYLEIEKERIDLILKNPTYKIQPKSFKRKGKMITGSFDPDSEMLAQILLEKGAKVKLILEGLIQGGRWIKETKEAVINSIAHEQSSHWMPPLNFHAKLEDTKNSRMIPYKSSLAFKPGNEDDIKRQAKLRSQMTTEWESFRYDSDETSIRSEWDNEKLEYPAKIFLSGEFPEIPAETWENESHPNLDEEQNKAFQMAMNIEHCPVLFLHGGPGAGKTHTEVEIIDAHIKAGRRVLLLSDSNQGSQVPAVGLKEKIGKFEALKNIHVAGNNPDSVNPKLQTLRMKRGGPSFPKAQLQAINNLSDKEVYSQFMFNENREEKESFRDFMSWDFAGNALKAAREKEKQKTQATYNQKKDIHKAKTKEKIAPPGVTVSTFGTLLRDEYLRDEIFDVVVVDEATRMRSPEMMQALQKAGKQIIFVGDPLQLGNIPLKKNTEKKMLQKVSIRKQEQNKQEQTENENQAIRAVKNFEDGPFTQTIMEALKFGKKIPYVFLDKNRRSLPNIVKVLSELMYDGKLKPGREEAGNEGKIIWHDTKNLKHGEKSSGTSKKNTVEAGIIGDKVINLLLRKENPVAPEDIGIIATYKNQADLIKRYIAKRLNYTPGATRNKDLFKRLIPNIATVDKFQGDERKVVFVSLTRSNEEGNVGFLEEVRRIGVAVGRARDELHIVGNTETVVDRNTNSASQKFMKRLKFLVKEHGEILEEAA